MTVSHAPRAAGPRLRIVAINDVYDLDALPRLASLIAHSRTVDAPDVLLVTLAGDFLSPSMLSSLDGGAGMVDCLNAIGVTHVIFGNHEDDLDRATLDARIAEFEGIWLSSNIFGFTPPLPRQDIVTVANDTGEVRVGLIGVCTLDPMLYRTPPFDGAPALPPLEVARDLARTLMTQEGCALVLPLTHLPADADRALIEATTPLFPVVLGGHDHQRLTERVGETWLLKAGADAEHAHIVDIAFDDGRPTVSVRVEDVANWPEEPRVAARVAAHLAPLRELESAVIFVIPPGMTLSSTTTRREQTSLGTFLTSHLRDIFRADVCLINGGGIRGRREHRGLFTYGDLKTEIPFDNEMTVAHLPGHVIRDAIRVSRSRAPVDSGAFLQVDDLVDVNAEGTPTRLGGQPLDPDRVYAVALIRELLGGMDGIAPLQDYARAHPACVPPAGTGREVKQALVESFARGLFAELGGHPVLDTDRDGFVTVDDIARRLGSLVDIECGQPAAKMLVGALDRNHDGRLDHSEVAPASVPQKGDGDALT